MKKCPVCNAEYKGKNICHRCKTDLGTLLAVEGHARHLKEKSIGLFHEGRPHRMLETIEQSCALKETPETRRIMACAALLARDFDRALDIHFHSKKEPQG